MQFVFLSGKKQKSQYFLFFHKKYYMVYSIDNEKIKKLTATIGNKIYYGGSQSWYPSFLQRLSGCGATTASNLFACIDPTPFATKEHRLEIMQNMWLFVTPGIYGLDHVEDFASGSNKFFEERSLPYECTYFKYPDDKKRSFDDSSQFVKTALSENCLIAFLNLSNGAIELLESHHWVTIVSFDDGTNIATIFDGSQKFDMDLKLLHNTTPRRGGFARYKNKKT